MIAPTILAAGVTETSSAAITAGAAILRLPLAVVILTGVISIMVLRLVMN